MNVKTADDPLQKTAAEAKLYTFDYSGELEVGETITTKGSVSASPTTTPALTIGSTSLSPDSRKVQVLISAGLSGTTYRLVSQVVTSASETIVGAGILIVGDP